MYRILICDDEKDIVNALKIYLADANYQLFEAFTGREALELIRREEIHLVLMDIMMPVMDGYQALKAIRDIEEEKGIPVEKRVKIIMMTALNEERNVKKAFEMGCTVYCAKPVDIEKLKEVLQKLSLV